MITIASQWVPMVYWGRKAGSWLLVENSPWFILRWCGVLLAGCKKSGPFNTPYLLRSGHWWPEPSLAWLLFIIDTQALKLMIIFSGQLAELRHWRSFVLAIWLLLLSVVRLFKIPTYPHPSSDSSYFSDPCFLCFLRSKTARLFWWTRLALNFKRFPLRIGLLYKNKATKGDTCKSS